MSGEEGEEPRPANIYIHGLISIVREGDQGPAWLECGKLGLGEADNVESLSHTHTHHIFYPFISCWHLGSSCMLAIVNTTAVNTELHVSFQIAVFIFCR